jgi:ribA/ribD-fused uncharacterized protein
MKSILFYSRSKSLDARSLSNFHLIDGGIKYKDVSFPSVENAFQASKYLYTNSVHTFLKFSYISPKEAKKLGSKSAMKANGVSLNKEMWDSNSWNIMKELIDIRYEADIKFKNTIDRLNQNKILIYHFERSGPNSIWGGYFDKNKLWLGQNQLGRIMMNCSI